MPKITIGEWLKNCREESNISINELVEGICTYQFLDNFESGQENCSLELFCILLQRLGYSPDKLEYILSGQEYRSECLWGFFMAAVFQKRREWSERLFAQYAQSLDQKKKGKDTEKELKDITFKKSKEGLWKCPKSLDSIGKMYLFRGRALMAYWMDNNLENAEEYLKCALDSTFPRWKQKDWIGCRISLIELENALALVRIWREQKGEKWNLEKNLLERCGTYIQKKVKDKEEHAKIYSKYAWIAADVAMEQGEWEEAIFIALKAFEELRQFGIEYFAIPILENLLTYYKRAENRMEKNSSVSDLFTQFQQKNRHKISEIWITEERCANYYRILNKLHEKYLAKWYPKNSILWNCCQRMYHLDVEVLFAERRAFHMTQEKLAEGIYRWVGEISRIENGKVSPSWKHFNLMMEKFGMNGEQRSFYINTDLSQALEWLRDIQVYASRHQYDGINVLLRYLEEELDMKVMENWRIVRFYHNVIAIYAENPPLEKILKEDLELLWQTWHIPLEALGEQAKLEPKKMRGKNKNTKGKKYIYRAPLRIEALLLNQIATLLKMLGRSEEARNLYEGVIHTIEKSRILPEFQFYSYSPLLGNMAKQKYSITDAETAIRTSLRCGNMVNIGNYYLTIACAMLDDSSNRECCMQMMRDCYYLFELSDHQENMRTLRKYFKDRFNVEINQN